MIRCNGIHVLSRVIAVRLIASNNTIWESSPLDGACSGTPKISSDGMFVFLTHNLVSVGHFTILLSDKGTPFYSQFNPVQPYSPLGIFHNPVEGHYSGGTNNTNDILVWAYAPFPEEVGVGQSGTFGFQFPVDFNGTPPDEGFRVITLYNATFQSTAAPLLVNHGLNLYFSASRSTFASWVGMSGRNQGKFDRGATGKAEFNRGSPRQLAPFCTLASSNANREELMLFGGTAGFQFVALNSSGEELWNVSTDTTIQAEAKVSPDNSRVYFVESNGKVHSLNTTDGSQHWEKVLTVNNSTIISDFAIMERGESLYFGDSSGTINAWTVATVHPSSSQLPTSSILNATPPSQSLATPIHLTSIAPSTTDDQSDSLAPSRSINPISLSPSQKPLFTQNVTGTKLPSGVSLSPSIASSPSSVPTKIFTTPLIIPSEIPSSTSAPTSSLTASNLPLAIFPMGNFSSGAPLESPKYTPVLPPSPGEPPCNICGGNLSITLFNGTVKLPTDPPSVLSCEKWLSLGNSGYITTTQCQLAPNYTRECGCQKPEMLTTAPTVASSSTPSISAVPELIPNTTSKSVAPTATSAPLTITTTPPSSAPGNTDNPTELSIPLTTTPSSATGGRNNPTQLSIPLTAPPSSTLGERNNLTQLSILRPMSEPSPRPSGNRLPTSSAGNQHCVTLVLVMVLGIAIFK